MFSWSDGLTPSTDKLLTFDELFVLFIALAISLISAASYELIDQSQCYNDIVSACWSLILNYNNYGGAVSISVIVY